MSLAITGLMSPLRPTSSSAGSTTTEPAATPAPAPTTTTTTTAPEAGVTYQPAAPAEEPVTYSASSPSASQPATESVSAAPAAAPAATPATQSSAAASPRAAASQPAKSEVSITERVAQARSANVTAVKDAGESEAVVRADVSQLMAAYARQFGGTSQHNLKQLLG